MLVDRELSALAGADVTRFESRKNEDLSRTQTAAHSLKRTGGRWRARCIDREPLLQFEAASGCGSGVEHHLAKVRVVGSNPIIRSIRLGIPPASRRYFFRAHAGAACAGTMAA